jgi:hypothetical protein
MSTLMRHARSITWIAVLAFLEVGLDAGKRWLE